MNGKLCVPREKTDKVLLYYHNAGHVSGYKLYDIVTHRCQFEQEIKKVRDLCIAVAQSCHICQAVKANTRPYGTVDFFPVPSQIFSSLCMDFLSLLAVTGAQGKKRDTVLVIVDRLSGYIIGIPCQKSGLTAEAAAELFLKHCVYLMGVPLEILSDNDNLITSKFFQTLCDMLGIEQHSAIIYRPKGNGRAERAVRSVVGILRLTLTGIQGKQKWIDVLPWACFLQNSLPGVIAGYSPHKIVFGKDLILPGELPLEEASQVKKSPSAESWFSMRDKTRQMIQEKLSAVHDSERKRYIREHCQKQYVPGDKVWVKVLSKDK